jgi:cellulose synthase/poly-beta-1,6-N-acetylglucosamine synthase-like glycosyltransferase
MCFTISAILFWLAGALIVYAYAGFKPVLSMLAMVMGKRVLARTLDFKPCVTIFIPAYNEEKVIQAKIDNCRAQTYPQNLLEIMVCSDCSNDRTAEIVNENTGPGTNITFLDYKDRSGKTGLINKAIPQARGDIVILTDANTMFKPEAVERLVSCYSSDKIGAVLGQVKLEPPKGSAGLNKETAYRAFETDLKFREGLFGAALGAFGGLYSIRKELFRPLPANAYSNDDFLIPMRILSKGNNVALDMEAISIEETATSVEEEFKRRVRIGAGNFQSFFLLMPLLNPFTGFKWFLYISHKVLRWFSPFLLLIALGANISLIHNDWYCGLFILQACFYLAAILGWISSQFKVTFPFLSSAYHFCSMNLAILFGFFRYLRGIKSAVWQSTERTAA